MIIWINAQETDSACKMANVSVIDNLGVLIALIKVIWWISFKKIWLFKVLSGCILVMKDREEMRLGNLRLIQT